jgi:hypothetical protein
VSSGGGAAAGGVTVGQGKKTWALQRFCGSARTRRIDERESGRSAETSSRGNDRVNRGNSTVHSVHLQLYIFNSALELGIAGAGARDCRFLTQSPCLLWSVLARCSVQRGGTLGWLSCEVSRGEGARGRRRGLCSDFAAALELQGPTERHLEIDERESRRSAETSSRRETT